MGVAIDGIALTDVSPRSTDTLRRLLAEHGVLIMRDQHIDDDEFLALLRAFGKPVFTAGETPVPGHPDLNVITNVGRTTPPRSVFHVDTSYVSHPPAYTALRAVRIPAHGGQTLFTNQYRAAQTLPDDVRARLQGRSIRHVVTGVEPGDAQEHEAWHPALRPHSITGRESLYLSTPQRCVEVSGLSAAESRELIQLLYTHSTRPANTLRHTWRAGDVVMWDNGCVLHRADHDGVVGDRVMHRGMVLAP
ncbi:TauD/TfdA dioxygenase family protein [uncultured Jatrophihabitans sp.]|uniref:TauD/TfdA dioxygenase family protein n=1 Tax=uncultured Jatrophihabitans sp. TaxID=1610747 RepID=UPI0035CA02FC